MNIVLTGLRGSGKSKIGKILNQVLGWKLIDLDKKIEKSEKMKITQIVEKHGWDYFREKEKEAAIKAAESDKTIIACGGGTIIDKENEKILNKNGKIIYLYCTPEICAKRIMDSKDRPPLTDKESIFEELEELYKERNGRYCKSADIIFQRTENPEEDVSKIIEKLSKFTSFNAN